LTAKIMTGSVYPIAPPLLGWFASARRSLPFREDPTPYHIWVSEIMLQQTRMTAVLPYYTRFIEALPDVRALAACDPQQLHKLWEGLGYYSRVRNMQKAAQVICREYGGQIPTSYKELMKLPGIGAYTAGAIASISYGHPVPAVDGNVLRVFSRLYNDTRDSTTPAFKEDMTALVCAQQPPDAPGDFNQALMELGALVCTPRSPDCIHCPLRDLCAGWQALGETVELLPKKPPKKERKSVAVTVLIVRSPAGVLVMQRPDAGLLANLWQPLLLETQADKEQMIAFAQELGVPCTLQETLPAARHIFTHIEWNLGGFTAWCEKEVPLPAGYAWMKDRKMFSIPSAFKAYKPYMDIR